MIYELWPDPDRRDAALIALAERVYRTEPRGELHPEEIRTVQALSVGLEERGAAEVLGVPWQTVHERMRRVRSILGAKNTTQACCEALRRGLIR